MDVTPLDSSHLERELLRKSVDALRAGAERCHDCQRTPLVGERVYHYAGGRMTCELCRAVRREQPERSDLVRSNEHGATVRLTVSRIPAEAPYTS
jgi:hypothetical protein